ncbi:hypothetical protein G6F16_004900 [Rhizopus arrhizus]|nr:hypothetical protein G6F21_003807 [Rhizopus arrhizus]KAG0802358.1 hypothetical protein G6F22_000334 [Rhizopus arrhizus]KAG0814666.1 hypothetical protein G6F20_004597 [Rhizopus arrhizus]KAG0834752.1 hypothetical protein G6F19_005044 [Rhizopus arrhizus]KAG0837424.1 hypothetical protein G6F18_004915 [Rhizopus arrhizus]
MSSSPYHIRRSFNQKKKSVSHFIEPKPLVDTNTLSTERTSFDSTHTDLSSESQDVIIANQWIVLERIGVGSFGEVFEAENMDTRRKYAIKREPLKMRRPQIKHENDIYNVLAGCPGIPQCHWYGQHDKFDCIVIDLLGPNLNQLREVTMKFPINVVVDFGCQIVSIMEHIHKKGLVYRDIKPDNFLLPFHCILPEPEMIELSDSHDMSVIQYRYPSCDEVFQKWNMPHPKLYLVDFGLTTWWKNPDTGKPYPDTKKHYKNKAGTARYASLNIHRGKPHSPRDDIESIGYLLLDLILGTLPWAGIQARNSRAGWDRMKQIKQDTFLCDLCGGLPQGILEYMEYARNLKFSEEPDYELLRQYLRGSVKGERYSSIVKSPFGEHTDIKWTEEIDRSQTTTNRQQKQQQYRASPMQPSQRNPYIHNSNSHNDADIFLMDNLAHATNDIKYNTSSQKRYDCIRSIKSVEKPTDPSQSSFQNLLNKTKKKQKRVGWNSHKHDNEQWTPVTDWATLDEKTGSHRQEISWGENNPGAAWDNTRWETWSTDDAKEEKGAWATSVHKPWE